MSLIDFFAFRAAPTTEIGIGGYKLVVRIKEEVMQENEIPDIPLEDGSFEHEHIINRPDKLVIQGDIGGIVVQRPQINDQLAGISSFVDTAAAYLPRSTSEQARKIRNRLATTLALIQGYAAAVKRGAQLLNLIGEDADHQKDFFEKMTRIIKSKELIDVSMPFKTYKNMAIESLLTEADNEATSLGFEMTLKQITFIKEGVAEKIRNIDSVETEKKIAPVANKGVQTPETVLVEAETVTVTQVNQPDVPTVPTADGEVRGAGPVKPVAPVTPDAQLPRRYLRRGREWLNIPGRAL